MCHTHEAGPAHDGCVAGTPVVLPPGPPLGATATSYVDTSAEDGHIYCYFVAPVDAVDQPLGVADPLCTEPGDRAGPGTALPGAFTLGLNQSPTATLTWQPPAGGADAYELVVIPLNFTPPAILPLGAGATSTTYDTAGVGTCFILVGKRAGVPPGNTDPLCGVPGVATLGRARTAGAAAPHAGAVAAAVREAASGAAGPR